jgi:hypothetical protein
MPRQSQSQQSDQPEVVRNEDAQPAQAKPTADQSAKDVKASILHEPSRDIHPSGEPEHLQDQTSAPTPYAPADRPPLATPRFDEPIVQSLVTGAGAHEPPDPDVYDPEGRVRDGR